MATTKILANETVNTVFSNAVIDTSMIGSSVEYKGTARDLSMGDFSTEQ
jgi:hypothetical protein